MNVQLLAVDGMISLCCSLAWVAVAALARRAWWPDSDARIVLLIGLGVFAVVFGFMDWVQGGGVRLFKAIWQGLKWLGVTFVLLWVIQLVMVAMGAG